MRKTVSGIAWRCSWLLMAGLWSGCDVGVERTVDLQGAAPASAPATVRHVDAAGAEQLLASDKTVVVLDVRTPSEFAGGHLAGATNVDFNEKGFATELARLDRQKTYLVHCAVGGRSTKALPVFKELGFRSVVHLDGGINAWRAAGKPVVK